MKFRPRTLYAKIFLWFCLTILVSTVLVLLVASLAGSQPFGRRWMAMTQDLYARSAVDFYTTGGAPALSRYLASIRKNSGIEGQLIDAQGTDVLGSPISPHAQRVYLQVRRTGHSAAHLGRYWTAASAVETASTTGVPQQYIFVMEAHPTRGFLDGTFFNSMAPRILGGVLLVALFCLLLARHITRPIRVLQEAATRMASGDLSVRTLPALRGRADELASMSAAFDAMAERIQTLLQTQRQMLSDISHELRSPLTRIGVSLELLRRGEVDVLEPMQADLDRLNAMIGQILDLTRFEMQQQPLPTEDVELQSILQEIVESANYEGRAAGKAAALQSCGVCVVAGDETALRSCIENVVRNALQHSPAGGAIELSLTTSADTWATVRVEDNGPGVPPDALARLFTPFFRVPEGNRAHPGGSGLGLSISARIAALHGGSVTAVNRSTHGLSVTIDLPLSTKSIRQL